MLVVFLGTVIMGFLWGGLVGATWGALVAGVLMSRDTAALTLPEAPYWSHRKEVHMADATEGAAYVQNRLRAVDETVQDYTGKPLQQWTEDLKSLMREKPLMGAALMIGVGFALGKFVRR